MTQVRAATSKVAAYNIGVGGCDTSVGGIAIRHTTLAGRRVTQARDRTLVPTLSGETLSGKED